MKFVDKKSLTFDDVILLPQYSDILSRKDTDTSVNVMGLKLDIPFISSNMDTITTDKMAVTLWKAGAIGCLHRFMSIKENVTMFEEVLKQDAYCMVSIGVGNEEFERGAALIRAGARHIIIDVAHGASFPVVRALARIREYADTFIQEKVYFIVGNFATMSSYMEFMSKSKYAPDALKIGIGGGSNCSTRVQTGHGLGNISTILEFQSQVTLPLIIDGGVRNSGDAVKALACGANLIMGGNIIAGSEETPGDIVTERGNKWNSNLDDPNNWVDGIVKKFKKYRGSASSVSYEAQGKTAEHRPPEGVARLVPYKGSVTPIIKEFQAGIRSGLSYSGAKNIRELYEKALFSKVSHASLVEGKPKNE